MRYVCLQCGHVYDEAESQPDNGIPPSTDFSDLPDDWECPFCGATKDHFELEEEE
jgi:rubredoxin